LAGERAHYELAKSNRAEAERLRKVMAAQTSPGGLIPEQVWDAPDVPEYELFNGQPSGSAMPLVWAHAEYAKLVRSLHDGRVFDLPPQPVQRYQVDQIASPYAIWRFNQKARSIPAGKKLRVEVLAPAMVQWRADNRKTTHNVDTTDTTLGTHIVDLPVDDLKPGRAIIFTFFWCEDNHWEGTEFTVQITG
jgi:glucoamylase